MTTTVSALAARSRLTRGGGSSARVVALVLIVLWLPVANAQEPREPGLAGRLIRTATERYQTADAYRLDFVQEAYWSLADSTQVINGTLAVVNPSSVSIRYSNGGRIVVRGESLWVYVPETNQFFKSRVDSSDVVVDPARLLKQYAIDENSPVSERADGRSVVTLRPHEPGREPCVLTVDIERASGLIDAIAARTSTGDRTTYRILETRFEVPFPPDEFTLRRPQGAELIEGGPAQ